MRGQQLHRMAGIILDSITDPRAVTMMRLRMRFGVPNICDTKRGRIKRHGQDLEFTARRVLTRVVAGYITAALWVTAYGVYVLNSGSKGGWALAGFLAALSLFPLWVCLTRYRKHYLSRTHFDDPVEGEVYNLETCESGIYATVARREWQRKLASFAVGCIYAAALAIFSIEPHKGLPMIIVFILVVAGVWPIYIARSSTWRRYFHNDHADQHEPSASEREPHKQPS